MNNFILDKLLKFMKNQKEDLNILSHFPSKAIFHSLQRKANKFGSRVFPNSIIYSESTEIVVLSLGNLKTSNIGGRCRVVDLI